MFSEGNRLFYHVVLHKRHKIYTYIQNIKYIKQQLTYPVYFINRPCIKQPVCKVLNKFQHGKYLVAYGGSLAWLLRFFVKDIYIIMDQSKSKIMAIYLIVAKCNAITL